MMTRMTDLVVKAAVVAGLSMGLVFGGGLGTAGADHAEVDNYFHQHPGPLNGRTGIDPYDPYAPVDLGGAGGALRLAVVSAASVGTGAADPCSPQRCRAW